MKHINHQLQYIEFACTDFAAIKEFYSSAFGWNFSDYGEGDQVNYIGFEGDNVDGGFYIGEVKQGSIVPILYGTDLTATKSAVEAAGGAITQDIFPFPGGKRFHFTDPSGNELAVWSDQ